MAGAMKALSAGVHIPTHDELAGIGVDDERV